MYNQIYLYGSWHEANITSTGSGGSSILMMTDSTRITIQVKYKYRNYKLHIALSHSCDHRKTDEFALWMHLAHYGGTVGGLCL